MTESSEETSAYGHEDATHRALGGASGIRRLVELFYEEMDTRPEAKRIRDLHPLDLEMSIDKLACFLSGWTGGPKLFSEKYGSIKLPIFHQHLPVEEAERDAWMLCMEGALGRMDYASELQSYMMRELYVPADRIRVVVANRRAGRAGGKNAGAIQIKGKQP